MKKIIFAAILLASMGIYAQDGKVGVGNTDPKATLDVTGTPATATIADGIIAPRLTGDELAAKDAVYISDQTGAQVYITAAATTPAGKTINVTTPGYYYFDGAVWQKVSTNAPKFEDGTLTFPSSNTSAGIFASSALANTKEVFIGNDGSIKVGGTVAKPSAEAVKYNFTADNDFTNGLSVDLYTSDVTNKNRNAANFNTELQDGSITSNLKSTRNGTDIYGTATANSVIVNDNEAWLRSNYTGTINNVIGSRVWLNYRSGSAGIVNSTVGLAVFGEALEVANRPGTNRIGLRISNVVPTSQQPDATAFSILTNAGKVSFGDVLQLRTVNTGTAISGLGVDVDGNVIKTSPVPPKFEDGTLTFPSTNTSAGIFASSALANGKEVFIGNDGSIKAGGTVAYPSAEAVKYTFTADNDFTSGLALDLYTSDATNKSRNAASFNIELQDGSITDKLRTNSNVTSIYGTATADLVAVTDNEVWLRSNYTGTIDRVVGYRTLLNYRNGSAGVINNTIGIDVLGAGLSDANKPGTNRIGLNIASVVPTSQQPNATAFSIRTNAGKVSFGDDVEQRGTGAFKVATGTTAQRPTTAEVGMIRFNTSTSKFEGFDGTNWVDLN